MANAKWSDDSVQFPRLLAEISATQPNLDFEALCASMDLEIDDINDIFDRADEAWEKIKREAWEAGLPKRKRDG